MVLPAEVRVAVEDAHRSHWATVLAATVRVTRDLDLAEECAQEAFARALTSWRTEVPGSPGGWLAVVARRVALDRMRHEATGRRLLPQLLVEAEPRQDEEHDVDPLRLLMMCCHPALSLDAQLALTLRLMCGLSTAQIGRALLVQEATVAARITRAKRKIAVAAIPFRLPDVDALGDRLSAALHVVYLAYTAGHTDADGTTDELGRDDLVRRAVAIARRVRAAVPGHSETAGLLAMMLFGEARKNARTDDLGHLVLLEDQDRDRWDQQRIREGLALATEALTTGDGRFAYEAAIAGLHAVAPSFEQTDWPQVVVMYDRLYERWPTPIVALNRVAARSFVPGVDLEDVLAALDEIAADGTLDGYAYLAATRAHVLARLGRPDAAAAAYDAASARTRNEVERAFIAARRSALVGAVSSGRG